MYYFFEFLEKKKLTPNKVHETIYKWTDKQIFDFIDEAIILLPVDKRKAESLFDYVSNSELSGSKDPCANLNCRLEWAERLARITSLYADRVLIRNPFTSYQYYNKLPSIARTDLANDITILYYFKPLLDEGLIGIVANDLHFCADCYDNYILSQNSNLDVRIGDVREALEKKYSKECKYTLTKEGRRFFIEAAGPENLIHHTTFFPLKKLPESLKSLKTSHSKKISKKALNEIGAINYLINPILDDLILQNWSSSLYGSNYLTNRDIDLEVIQLVNSSSNNITNQRIYKSFSHSVPFIQKCRIDDLIKLRTQEGESFQVYRDSLTSLLQKAPTSNIKTLKEAFADEIQPELNKINLTINKSEKTVWKGLTRDVAIGGCFVGVGLSSGILPANIAEIVGALGGFKYVSNIADKVSSLISKSDQVRDNKYYFLWKLQQQTTR